jgi:hypothetical protein
LRSAGYIDIPELPGKTLFSVSNEAGLDRRRYGLQIYLQQLLHVKILRNSPELIKFLELHKFCPEFLVNSPQLLFKGKEKQGYNVALFKFIPKYNIFVTASNNKKANKCNIKIYNFKVSTLLEESYIL